MDSNKTHSEKDEPALTVVSWRNKKTNYPSPTDFLAP